MGHEGLHEGKKKLKILSSFDVTELCLQVKKGVNMCGVSNYAAYAVV